MIVHLTATEVLAGFGGLIVLLAVWRTTVKAARRATDTARADVRLMSLAGRVVITAGLIVAVQWIVVTHAAGNATLIGAVLGGPALLAGYTLTRALTITTTDTPRSRGGRR